MLTEEKLAIITKVMEQAVIMMGQLRQHHMEQARHMELEIRLMEEVATQVVLLAMKLEIIPRVGTASLFLMLEQDMVRLPVLLVADTHNRIPTSPTVNQVKLHHHDGLTVGHYCWHFIAV
jgi:hypothetical protein